MTILDACVKVAVELEADNKRLRGALRDIKKDQGHVSINNGTSTLGLFIDMVLKGAING